MPCSALLQAGSVPLVPAGQLGTWVVSVRGEPDGDAAVLALAAVLWAGAGDALAHAVSARQTALWLADWGQQDGSARA